MRNKILSLMVALTCLVLNFSVVSAITPSAKVELDNYSITISELKDVKISGTVSKSYGQIISDIINKDVGFFMFHQTIKWAFTCSTALLLILRGRWPSRKDRNFPWAWT